MQSHNDTDREAILAPLTSWLAEPVTLDEVREAVRKADGGDTAARLSDDGRVLTVSRWDPMAPSYADPCTVVTVDLDESDTDAEGYQSMLDALDPEPAV